MKISPAGITLITSFEGCRLEAYSDASPSRIPTIGYGHTGAGVMLGQRITQERACELLTADLLKFEAAVSRLVKVPITQCQFDALVSLVYNMGPFPFERSNLLSLLNSGDVAGAADQFQFLNHSRGEVIRGLTRRRAAERELFLGSAA